MTEQSPGQTDISTTIEWHEILLSDFTQCNFWSFTTSMNVTELFILNQNYSNRIITHNFIVDSGRNSVELPRVDWKRPTKVNSRWNSSSVGTLILQITSQR